VRFAAFQRKLNCLKDGWFIFDSLLVALMAAETWVMTLIFSLAGSSSSAGGQVSILRIARLMRLTRMARMARLLRAMPELMVLIKGMVAAMRAVFFALTLLTMLLYVFAIVMRQLTDATYVGGLYFPNVARAMQSLLVYGTFMDTFADFILDITEHSPHILPVVYLFVLISSLTMMNMLVGILVDVVQSVAATETEARTVNQVRESILEIMGRIDVDNDDFISRDEFQTLVTDPKAAEILFSVEVDVVSLVELEDFIFEESDDHGNVVDKTLSTSDFMELVLSLRGSNQATVKDIVQLHKFMEKEMKRLQTKLSSNERLTARMLDNDTDTRLARISAYNLAAQEGYESKGEASPTKGVPMFVSEEDSLVKQARKPDATTNGMAGSAENASYRHHVERLMDGLLTELVSHHERCIVETRSCSLLGEVQALTTRSLALSTPTSQSKIEQRPHIDGTMNDDELNEKTGRQNSKGKAPIPPFGAPPAFSGVMPPGIVLDSGMT